MLRGGYPSMLLGASGGSEHPETMIVQQMCINGNALTVSYFKIPLVFTA